MVRFPVARFHAMTGPPELFERVRFKMRDVRILERPMLATFRTAATSETLLSTAYGTSTPDQWRLLTAEVRTDKGKFVNSAWSVDVDGQEWWVVIGFDATMKTVIRAARGKLALGADIVRCRELHDFVASVNRQLMLDEVGVAPALLGL